MAIDPKFPQGLDSEHFIECVVSVEPNVLYILDLEDNRVVYVNHEINAALGYTQADIQGMGKEAASHLVHPEDLPRLVEHLDACRKAGDGDVLDIEFRLRHAYGNWHWFSSRATVLKFCTDGKAGQILGIAEDINEHHAAQDKLWFVSTHDSLTELYNRAMFDTEADRLEKSRRYPVTVLMADVVGFRMINHVHGYDTGDKCLRDLAGILRDAFRSDDIVARLGADLFGILLPNTNSVSSEAVQLRIRNRLDNYNQKHPDIPLIVRMSILSVEQGGSLCDTILETEKRLSESKVKR